MAATANQVLAAVKEQLDIATNLTASWAEGKPWITEEETKGATDKVLLHIPVISLGKGRP